LAKGGLQICYPPFFIKNKLKKMQIITKSGTRLLNFMPRETIDAAKVYELKITSEEQNKVILTDSNASFTLVKYYYTYSTTQALDEANFYTIEINNTTDGTLIFKDKLFCTDQTLSTFEISNNVYIEKSTSNNEYIYA
jgi:hypothetical protein